MKKLLLVSTILALAACGDNTTDRAAVGAGIGAVTGAVVGSTIGHGGAGALVGGAAGAAVGGMTTPDEIDLGKPVWR
jgi:osmotically inducible lipoprotein OsmB